MVSPKLSMLPFDEAAGNSSIELNAQAQRAFLNGASSSPSGRALAASNLLMGPSTSIGQLAGTSRSRIRAPSSRDAGRRRN
jgi:hypothetical protein